MELGVGVAIDAFIEFFYFFTRGNGIIEFYLKLLFPP